MGERDEDGTLLMPTRARFGEFSFPGRRGVGWVDTGVNEQVRMKIFPVVFAVLGMKILMKTRVRVEVEAEA